ncbi:DUF5694 domain-containing protein [uncultured Pedobacter sp.]|uniref:DUF5694 domain-containing protein n=1 Tax=uncultured Pedobacter sp. TaxID=246139 RepID=UPI0025F3599E|nr:DUF5694 domain-containing protein [uncultured Pedobacter sp.]
MKKTIFGRLAALAILSLICIPTVFAQQNKSLSSTKSYFPQERTKVLFVGSFHFHYPGLDAHVTSNDDKVDVLSPTRQKELTDLVNYIKKFRPTKTAIEALPEWKATQKLNAYKKGAYRTERDERYQLGMRIATELKLDTIYSIDDHSMVSELSKIDPEYFKALFKDYDYKSEDPYSKMYERWYKAEDSLRAKTSLLVYFKQTNSKRYHQLGHGAYLVGDFKLDDKRGADALAINWYSRNLRIFRNLQEITESPKDRILVIFGNGHGAILRQLLESSPEYEFIEFDSLK